MEHFPLLIPGATPAGHLEVVAPFDRTPIAIVDTAGAEAIELALGTAHKLYEDRDTWLPLPKRLEILEKLQKLILERAEDLALEAAREGGKPLLDSRVEIARAADSIRVCVETMRTDAGREIPMNLNASSAQKLAVTRREPIGVVVAISAFNHPLNLIAHQVGPAVAAGCPVIVKPAEDTPLSCMRFVQMLREAGLPEEWCQACVTKDLETAEKLATDSRVAFLTFIGSAKVGWMLRSRLAPGARCALEHGGIAPVIVAEDADWRAAVGPIAKAGFYHAGQVCVSAQRIYVHESIAFEFAEALAEVAKKQVIGDPTKAETEIGPLIRPQEVTRVNMWVREAVAEGAVPLSGAEPLSETCYKCSVLWNVPETSKVSTQEVFGPVVCVYPYSELDDAIERANKTPFSFQAAIYTRSIDTAMRAYSRLNGSAIMVNEHTAFRVDWMPFAGLKQSGHGIGGIPYSIRDMQVEKMLVVKSLNL
ncbi:MAG: aldehyde dehydrogenase family protein [Calditrichaeota bacterium]|nr:aldehyde dehydrogenase family protein [Calditrichota bacterium]MCB9391769.1 aldehyde dehydrogenase family protein [Calditrichota bacterium]